MRIIKPIINYTNPNQSDSNKKSYQSQSLSEEVKEKVDLVKLSDVICKK
ncbi:MAG: hypothetical protein GX021_06740 [Tissierellia bacterium]|nr:hypothetical protein [Tissierellia bacterium]